MSVASVFSPVLHHLLDQCWEKAPGRMFLLPCLGQENRAPPLLWVIWAGWDLASQDVGSDKREGPWIQKRADNPRCTGPAPDTFPPAPRCTELQDTRTMRSIGAAVCSRKTAPSWAPLARSSDPK